MLEFLQCNEIKVITSSVAFLHVLGFNECYIQNLVVSLNSVVAVNLGRGRPLELLVIGNKHQSYQNICAN